MATYRVDALIETHLSEDELGLYTEEALMFLSETSVLKDLTIYEVTLM